MSVRTLSWRKFWNGLWWLLFAAGIIALEKLCASYPGVYWADLLSASLDFMGQTLSSALLWALIVGLLCGKNAGFKVGSTIATFMLLVPFLFISSKMSVEQQGEIIGSSLIIVMAVGAAGYRLLHPDSDPPKVNESNAGTGASDDQAQSSDGSKRLTRD